MDESELLEEEDARWSLMTMILELASYPFFRTGPFKVTLGNVVLLLIPIPLLTYGVWIAENYFHATGLARALLIVDLSLLALGFVLLLDVKAQDYVGRFLEKTNLDPASLRSSYVVEYQKPAVHWLVRGLSYAVFALSVGTLSVFHRHIKPLTFLAVYEGALANPIVSATWINTALWPFLSLLVADRFVPVVRWVLRNTSVFRRISVFTLLMLVVQTIGWVIAYWCPAPFYPFIYSLLMGTQCPQP